MRGGLKPRVGETIDQKAKKRRMLTRGAKRRIGQRDVWDVIVNNDDVCFKHILPRLNRTDIKFLYEVNTETRALIQRSSRKNALEDPFRVERMSSISTLEIAWENQSFWVGNLDFDLDCNEIRFCREVAKTNKLKLLKWAREEKKCAWDEETIAKAADQGNIKMVKYCVVNGCPVDEMACVCAAKNGYLRILKYLREEAKAPWDYETATEAARNGHLHILEYLVARKFDDFDENVCHWAALNGHLDCLKYLHETAKVPLDSYAVVFAHKNNHPECLQYLLDNNCPLPPDWRYEDGTLYDS